MIRFCERVRRKIAPGGALVHPGPVASVLTPALCRAARGLLNWTVRDLAQKAEFSSATISRFENERQQPHRATLRHLQQVFEAGGVEFTNGGQPGVRMRG